MNTKSIFMALGVMITLAFTSGVTAEAKSQPTDKKTKQKQQKVITVKRGDTLDAIAKKHDTTYVRLFNANPSIKNPDMIDVGDKIKIPKKDKKLEDRFSKLTTATPAPSSTVTTQRYTSAPVNSNSYYVGNGMWCTDYVHSKRPDVAIYGNAGYNWVSAAQAEGKSTGSAPKAGAVAVTNGHVAYVEKVNRDGSYVVSEMGWNYQAGNYNKRTVKPGAFGKFIY